MRIFLICIFAAFALIAVGSTWLTSWVISETPPFILGKLEELTSNKVLMDSIGGYRSFEYSYNENKFKSGDTVKYSITIGGGRDKLTYRGAQIKDEYNSWELMKDTLIFE